LWTRGIWEESFLPRCWTGGRYKAIVSEGEVVLFLEIETGRFFKNAEDPDSVILG
jgi:hypothetical protein